MKEEDILQKQYEFEIDRMDRLESSVKFQASLIVGLSISSIYFIEMAGKNTNILSIIFKISAILTIFFMVSSSLFIIYSYIVSKSAYLDHPSVLRDYRNALTKHDDLKGQETYESFLMTRLEEIATLNGMRNDEKSSLLYKAKMCIVLGMVPFFVSVVLYVSSVADVGAMFDGK